jgi:hypothetical protein
MHAPLRQPARSEEVHPNSWRGGAHYFRAGYAEWLINDYNTTGNAGSLNALLEHVEPLAKSILEYRSSTRHEAPDEFLSRIRLKLWRSLRLYDPARGSAFSFCAKIIWTVAQSTVHEAWIRNERFCEFNQSVDNALLCDPLASSEAVSDIQARVRMVRTPCTDLYELGAQKWLVDSFIDCEFHIRRHEAADAMSEVFGIDYTRSRWLFDTTLVAVRRQLIDGRRLTPVNPASLARTRSEALIRFAKFLSPPEFTRLASLMRDVAPSIVLTINPARACAVRRGKPEATRANLLLVLHGSPDDRPLFG